MRLKINKLLFRLFLTALLFYGAAGAEESSPTDQIDSIQPADSASLIDSLTTPDSTAEISDSVILEPVMYNLDLDSVLIGAFWADKPSEEKSSSPTTALFKSVAFPGWGQYSNRKYFKAGFIFAVESWFIFKAVRDGRDASDWRDKWKSTPDSLSSQKLEYFNKYTKYRNQRNTNIWYTSIIIFLSMFDAFVDAHLDRFPAKVREPESIALDIIPGEKPRLIVSYSF
ncbi:MAG: hypothetical protein GY841_05005 [FCB group bacterium]|nr:hypothetical protein [FCB group bacterium]